VFRLFSRLNVGGPAVHVILLTAGLRARGYSTRLVVGTESPREGNLLDVAGAKGVRCEQIASLGREIRPLADLRAFWTLVRMIRSFRPDVVHTHTAKAGLLGRLAARLAGVPVIVHTYHGHVLHGYFGPLRTALFRRAERALGHLSDVLVAVSESVRDDLVRLGVAERAQIQVVPLGLDLVGLTGPLPRGQLRSSSRVPDDAPLVGIVGRLAPVKDVPTFLEAAALVRRSLPEARFAVVGDGEQRAALEEKARRLALDDVVHFHGWQRHMPAVYGDLDLVVNCSRNEGTPVALIEALASGRPVIATRVGGTPDLLAGGEHGLLVPSGDAEALAAAVRRVLDDPGLAHRLGEAGRARAGTYSWERVTDQIESIYGELAGLATTQ
jgi:glycosyltransferase involved in cell wall biosynthesis